MLCLQFNNGIILKNVEWGTVSNALLKSYTAMSVWVPVSRGRVEKRLCMVVRSCVSQRKAALKSWLRYVRMMCSTR